MFKKLAIEIEKYIRFIRGRENDALLRQETTSKVDAYLKANVNKHKYVSYQVNCDDGNNLPTFVENGGFRLEVYLQRKNLKWSILSFTVEEDYMTFKEAWKDWKSRNKFLN